MTEEITEVKIRRTPPLLAGVSLVLTVGMLAAMLYSGSGSTAATRPASVPDVTGRYADLMEQQEHQFLTQLSGTQEGTDSSARENKTKFPVRKLSDADLIAPVPNPDAYGQTSDPAQLKDFFRKAVPVMEGQDFYFSADRERMPGSTIQYYVDDSIAVITWKEVVGYAVATFAEVKIMDGSQFRRFLAGGQFGAETQHHTTEMAQTVNAVLASSGDFYKFRYNGVVVYDGTVRRVNTNKADTCYIDDKGDLFFTYQKDVLSTQQAEEFVKEHNIRFSLTFGPVLVDNGQRCEPQNYDLGEVNSFSPRAALCQMDQLHYLVVTSNAEGDYPGALNMHQFAERIAATGCQKAYALDGGQTAAIALNGELVNNVLYGQQRAISDIIYFATSVGG